MIKGGYARVSKLKYLVPIKLQILLEEVLQVEGTDECLVASDK